MSFSVASCFVTKQASCRLQTFLESQNAHLLSKRFQDFGTGVGKLLKIIDVRKGGNKAIKEFAGLCNSF